MKHLIALMMTLFISLSLAACGTTPPHHQRPSPNRYHSGPERQRRHGPRRSSL